MSAPEAVEDAFNDLIAHQVGLLGGARNAIYDVLEKFDPETIQASCSQHSSLLNTLNPYIKYSKYWTHYTNNYESISGNAREEFEKVFEAAFMRAYEAQINKIK